MRISKNNITDTIADHFGANPLRIPETRIQPLCLLEIKDNKTNYLGEFKYMIAGSFDHDLEIKDSIVAEVSNVKTKKIEFDFGFKILSNFLKAFGMDPVVVSTAIKNSKKMSFSFTGVHRKYIDVLQLGKILSENDIYGDPNNIFISEIMSKKPLKLGLITDILVSNNFSLSTYSENETDVDIDIPLIEGYVSDAGINLKVNKTSNSEVKFEREPALTFAFSCVEIKVDPVTGKISRGDWMKNIRSAKGLEEINVEELTNEDWNRHSKMSIDDNKANPLLIEF